eukprot:TRINITY_DN111784_c0_g1_i1.p1 TRINITY_DN111784_c0_g1~~TRINITY_DN111784_c0_g1_i1.p1  ORF type:complete len:614 (+),score=69.89 TRINITY_DN111784_c0_g1_i1:174-2015(+)
MAFSSQDSSVSDQDVQERLLELESLISQVCRNVERPPSTSSGGGQTSTHRPRPASAGIVRPSSAQSLRRSSSGSGRPCSATSSRTATPPSTQHRPQSARVHRPHSGGSAASSRASLHASAGRRVMSQSDFQAMCDTIGHKAAARYKTINECFLRVDRDHSGAVDRNEVRELFRSFHLMDDQTDVFFDAVDTDGTGEISYDELVSIVAPYIQPGYKLPKKKRPPCTPLAPEEAIRLQAQRKKEADLKKLAEIVGSKAHAKYKSVRECFRNLDEDKSGTVSRAEVERFMLTFGFPDTVAGFVYNTLLEKSRATSDSDEVGFDTFMACFGPYIQPGYYQQTLNQRQREGQIKQRAQQHAAGQFTPPPRSPASSQGSERQRPQSARLSRSRQQQGMRPRSAGSQSSLSVRGVGMGAEDQFRPGSAVSAASATTCTTSASSSDASRLVRSSSQAKSNANWSKSLDSHEVRDRLIHKPDYSAARRPDDARAAAEAFAPKPPAQPPSKPRPKQANGVRIKATQRPGVRSQSQRPATPRKKVTSGTCPTCLRPKADEKTTVSDHFGSQSTCEPQTPKQFQFRSRSTSVRPRRADQEQHASVMSPGSCASLCSSLANEWSLL